MSEMSNVRDAKAKKKKQLEHHLIYLIIYMYVSYCVTKIVKSLHDRLYVKRVKGCIMELASYAISLIVM